MTTRTSILIARFTGVGRPRPRTTVAAVAVAVLAAAGLATGTAPSQAAIAATVTVNAGSSMSSFPAAGNGVNMAVWDGNMNTDASSTLLSAAGVKALRFPGGSYGDGYHWETHTTDDGGGYIASGTTYDEFAATARTVGADQVIIANYGSGTPQEAAGWVTYANKTKGYGAKYWEIGNEIYGNGHYGASWEMDKHADKSPKAYAENVLQYISAMKAVDSTIKIGVVLTTPGYWPDGVVGSGDSADWNHTVMSIVKDKADFVVVHYYPGATSSAVSLTKSAEIGPMVSTLRNLISQYAGTKASGIGIAITETNPSFQPNSATAGLFAADTYLTWWENGVFNVDWWDLRNGTDGTTTTNDDGTIDYADGGILSSGGGSEPPLNTPFPTYYGIALAGAMGATGDTLVAASSSSSSIAAHAVRTLAGGVNVMLINKDLNNSATVSLSYSGVTPSGTIAVRQWQKGASSITTTTQTSASSITVPPYSITVLSGGNGSTTPPTTTPPTTTPPTTTPPTTTPPATSEPPSATCTVSDVVSAWNTGLTSSITIKNTGTTAVNGWKLTFALPAGQNITNGWNAAYSPTSGTVTATNVSYNATIAAGSSTVIGFQATHTGNTDAPSSFALNGATCQAG